MHGRELERAAQTSCALDALVEKHQLGSMAYYYEGTERQRVREHRHERHRRAIRC